MKPWHLLFTDQDRLDALRICAVKGLTKDAAADALQAGTRGAFQRVLDRFGVSYTGLRLGESVGAKRAVRPGRVGKSGDLRISFFEATHEQKAWEDRAISDCERHLLALRKYHPHGAPECYLPPKLSEAGARRVAERFERIQLGLIATGNSVFAEI